ncbi:hypothetical protein CPB83DRAFT_854806 [Crepidotus variabilis]|uniref:BTB domain-containing protein n=1 Tax=Crepidotus variabilis TaxID=179855 RepID=A0A9P6EFZ4_9AGAR|nr:hypothetical protein CPB83DRAFT_854806 [Crepidotus variabilis]
MGSAVIHEEFNSANADITIQSCDNVRFCLHRKNLEVTTGGLPGKTSDMIDGVLYLPEPAKVLELLFLFTYPQRSPTHLHDLDCDSLLDISEAAEKYKVFFAISVSVSGLRSFTSTEPLKTLRHALKYDHLDLADEAAPNALFCNPTLVVTGLSDTYIVPWLLYQSLAYKKIFEKAESTLKAFQNTFTYCKVEQRGICVTCRTVIAAWIWQLKQLSTTEALLFELEKFEQYPNSNLELARDFCEGSCNTHRRCIYAAEISEHCKVGLQKSQKFSEYLLDHRVEDGSG